MHLKFRQLSESFAICRLPSDAPLPQLAATSSLASITRTGDELSLVCPVDQAPVNAKVEGPWICFQVQGPFPFAQTGVLASFIGPLAEHGVPIFAISTFDTDYVLVKAEHAAKARHALQVAGHQWIASGH
ncbi:MAG TPA: ACT domain-containing protein [Terriglobales bacterium]|nr:ACT domain-containing protein [Terriglobales bacterium]